MLLANESALFNKMLSKLNYYSKNINNNVPGVLFEEIMYFNTP